jgi:hypothetical protein
VQAGAAKQSDPAMPPLRVSWSTDGTDLIGINRSTLKTGIVLHGQLSLERFGVFSQARIQFSSHLCYNNLMRWTVRCALAFVLLAISPAAHAVITINTGVHSNIPKIIQGIVNVLLMWSGLVATALFLVGAIIMVASGGTDKWLSAGKNLMKSALIGYAFLLSSWVMISTMVYFIS